MFLLALALALTTLSFGQTYDELNEKANDCFDKGDYQCAEDIYIK